MAKQTKKKLINLDSNDIIGIIILIILLIIIKVPDFNFGTRINKNKCWPCVGYYTVSSGYGLRNTGIPLASLNHKGIDIGCPVGTKIVSVLDGKVLFTGYNKYRGYYIIIEHKNNVQTIYQHGQKNSFKVAAGQKIKAGQVIMLSGNTGISNGPHLHFEVKVNGENVNPKKWLKND